MSDIELIHKLSKTQQNRIISTICEICEQLKDDSNMSWDNEGAITKGEPSFCEKHLNSEYFEFSALMSCGTEYLREDAAIGGDEYYDVYLKIDVANSTYSYELYQQYWLGYEPDKYGMTDSDLKYDKIYVIKTNSIIEFFKKLYSEHDNVWELSNDILAEIKTINSDLEEII